MTITDVNAVVEAMENGGMLEGLLFPIICKYIPTNNPSAGWHFALFQKIEHNDMDTSPFVSNVIYLLQNGIVTLEGSDFLAKNV